MTTYALLAVAAEFGDLHGGKTVFAGAHIDRGSDLCLGHILQYSFAFLDLNIAKE